MSHGKYRQSLILEESCDDVEEEDRRLPTESIMSHSDQLRLRDYTADEEPNLSAFLSKYHTNFLEKSNVKSDQ